MRIIWIMAAAGATALSVQAVAKPRAGTPVARDGPILGAPGGAIPGWRVRDTTRRFMAGGWGSRRDGRRGRHHRRFRDDFFFHSFGFAGPFGLADPYGNGFFAGRGGGTSVRNGRPYYDYDRSYPYEWASAAAGGRDWSDEEELWEDYRRRSAPSCTVERGVRVCRGGR